MSTREDIAALTVLCRMAAEQALQAKLAMPPRPHDEVAAGAWDVQRTGLTNQIDSLGSVVLQLTTQAILLALEAAGPDLAAMRTATDAAQARIAQIRDVATLLVKVAAVLAVARAVVTLAGAPTPGAALGLADAVSRL